MSASTPVAYQPSFFDPPQLTVAVEDMANAGVEERGAIFTRQEVINFILDLVGYTVDEPLHERRALEPSFGGGDFLLALTGRLITSYRQHGGTDPVADLGNAIRGVGNLRFPQSLPEFQRLFPDDAACAAYLEKARWSDGFVCPHCQAAGEPFRFANRPGVLRCRKCRRDTGLTVGTVMARSHTPLSVWFWSAYLVSSQTPGVSAVQLRRQLGLSRYETAFQILHKLRAGMVRPDQDRIGGRPGDHVEVDETWVGGRTRGKGRGVHDKVLVASAVEVRQRKPGTKLDKRKGGRYAGRVRLAIVPDRSAESLCGFVECAVVPGTSLVTDDWSGYASLAKRGYKHLAIAERGDPQVHGLGWSRRDAHFSASYSMGAMMLGAGICVEGGVPVT